MKNYLDKRIHNLKTVSLKHYFAFIPDNYDDEIQKDIKASFTKHFLGLSSVDYTRKKYGSEIIPKNGTYNILLEDLTKDIWNISEQINNRLDNLIIENQSNITLGIVANFMRLENSYESSLFLIKNQFFFESVAINRMIFEQLNYCYNLSLMDNDDFSKNTRQNIRKKLKSTNINNLKKLFPDAELGSFYSYLSELSHLDYNYVSEYIELEDETQEYNVTYKSISQSFHSAFVLLKILDFQCMVFEYIMSDFADLSFEYITKIDKILKPKPKRITKRLLTKYQKVYAELLNSDSLPEQAFRRSKTVKSDSDLPF